MISHQKPNQNKSKQNKPSRVRKRKVPPSSPLSPRRALPSNTWTGFSHDFGRLVYTVATGGAVRCIGDFNQEAHGGACAPRLAEAAPVSVLDDVSRRVDTDGGLRCVGERSKRGG